MDVVSAKPATMGQPSRTTMGAGGSGGRKPGSAAVRSSVGLAAA